MDTLAILTPRIISVHQIMRDKKKPYTVYICSKIIRNDCMNGTGTEYLKVDLKFRNLNPKNRGIADKVFSSNEEALNFLSTFKPIN